MIAPRFPVCGRSGFAARARRRGAALVVVIMALGLLLSLGVPFLLASRLRSESAGEAFHRARARIAVESATEYAAHRQGESHPALDPTPLWDAAAEWNLSDAGPLPQSLGGAWEEAPESWGAEVESVQGRVSLGTAPPMLVQNLVHPCFLQDDVSFRDTEVQVTSTAGFPEQGLVLVGSRWMQYGGKTANAFTEVVPDPEPPDDPDATRFREGRLVLDARVHTMLLGRIARGGHRAPEFFADLLAFDLGDPAMQLPEEQKRLLERACALRTGGYGSATWSPGGWLTRAVDPEEPQILYVNDGTLCNAGGTVRLVPEEGEPFDALVLAARGGALLLARPAPLLPAFTTRVHPLRREPVDVNACAPEVLEALALGVGFRGAPPVVTSRPVSGRPGREWVNVTEARAFARRVAQERPLRGPDDLWERVLAPLSEDGGPLTDLDAWALLVNSVDPNSGLLRQSTTSFGYRAGDRYLQRINAAVRSRLGNTRARASERRLVHVAPPGPLLSVLHDQRSFEDFATWGRGLHGTVTLPHHVGKWSGAFGAMPNAITLRTGIHEETGLVVPSVDAQNSAVIPLPAREADGAAPGTQGRTEHFDVEPSPLGYDFAEGGFTESLEEWGIGTQGGFSNLEPVHLQGWFKFEGGLQDAVLFDVAGAETDRNRLRVALEGGELVMRGWGTAGEDPLDDEGFREAVTARVDSAEYPLEDRWVHVSVLLRGMGPRGVQLAVDGVPRGDVDGFTRLTAALGGYAPGDLGGEVSVESTEGFPERGAIRIGNEVVEYSSKSDTSFHLAHQEGPDGYFGGRARREPTDSLAITLDTDHPEGAAVELYGYSAILADDVSPGGGTLSGQVGPWSVAQVAEESGVDEIQVVSLAGEPFLLGTGLRADYVGPVELAPGEIFEEDEHYAEAFQSDGGYALMWQIPLRPEDFWRDSETDTRIGGMEIIRYSGREGTTLTISERSVMTPGIEDAEEGVFDPDGTTYVTQFQEDIQLPDGTPLVEIPEWKVFLMPISIKGSGVTDLAYAPGTEEESEFVQLLTDGDAGTTEWVRYDNIVDGAFLRDDWEALDRAIGAFYRAIDEEVDPVQDAPGGGGGGGGGPGAGGIGGGRVRLLQEPENDYLFRPKIGRPVENRSERIREIMQRYDFRGTMDTYDHEHQAGAELIPVFKTVRGIGPNRGQPGRFDRVAMHQPGETTPPDWFRVHWADVPEADRGRVRQGVWYVAFDQSPGLPYVASDFEQLEEQGLNFDVRNYARISKFPDHERPLGLQTLTLGGDVTGTQAPPAGWVDEFSAHTTAGMGAPSQPMARGCFYLEEDLNESEQLVLRVDEYDLLVDGYRPSVPRDAGQFLALIPSSGLLDVGGERIAYMDVNPTEGELVLAPDGRGLHGTEVRGHASGTKVYVVDGRRAVRLTSAMTASSDSVEVESTAGFHPNGLLLVDDELIHAPLRGPSANYMGMPRTPPEVSDGAPDGIFRGRFGTTPAEHPDGTLVYSFPTRWMDTYAPRSDSGARQWLQFGYEEPDAHWTGLYYEVETFDASQRVRVLARGGQASWEDDPANTPGLMLLERGRRDDGSAVPLGLRSDRLDLRVSWDWEAGAFDPVTFEAVGWTSAPRLRRVVVDYLAGTRVERTEVVRE